MDAMRRTEKWVTVAAAWLFAIGGGTLFLGIGEPALGIALLIPGLVWMVGVIIRSLLRDNPRP